MSAVKFSVIIPVYNVAPYLRACLDSVCVAVERVGNGERGTGNRCGVEIICVDDGSTDGSGEILDEYAARDGRFRVIHQPNAGEGAARNRALDCATGEWIVYLDSDDVLRDTMLEDVSRAIAENPSADMIGFGGKRFSSGSAPEWDNDDRVAELVDVTSCIPTSVALGVWQWAYRRQEGAENGVAFGDLRFKDYKLGADLVYVSACLARAKKVLVFGKQEYGYRIHASNISRRKKTAAMVRDCIQYNVEMNENFHLSGKRYTSIYARIGGNVFLEALPAEILGNPRSPEWDSAFAQWVEAVDRLKDIDFFSPWQRFVMHVVSRTKSRWIVRVLCVWPFRLKLLGIHR